MTKAKTTYEDDHCRVDFHDNLVTVNDQLRELSEMVNAYTGAHIDWTTVRSIIEISSRLGALIQYIKDL